MNRSDRPMDPRRDWLAKPAEVIQAEVVSEELASKESEVLPLRDPASGQLLPGQSGNPSGRPKLIREFQKWLQEKAYPKAQEALLACLESPDEKVRMMAVKETNDRLFGRATQVLASETGQPLAIGIVMLPPERKDG